MLVAVKGNREVKIDEAEKSAFITDGFKIIEVNGNGEQKIISDPDVSSEGLEKITTLEEEKTALSEELEQTKAELARISSEADNKTPTDSEEIVKQLEKEKSHVADILKLIETETKMATLKEKIAELVKNKDAE